MNVHKFIGMYPIGISKANIGRNMFLILIIDYSRLNFDYSRVNHDCPQYGFKTPKNVINLPSYLTFIHILNRNIPFPFKKWSVDYEWKTDVMIINAQQGPLEKH
jgi:hypothetical protein